MTKRGYLSLLLSWEEMTRFTKSLIPLVHAKSGIPQIIKNQAVILYPDGAIEIVENFKKETILNLKPSLFNTFILKYNLNYSICNNIAIV